MNRKNIINMVIIILIIGIMVFYGGLSIKSILHPHESFMIYLDGKKIGLIKNKQELLDKINNEQSALKEEYGIDHIYPPSGLKIVKYVTYQDNYLSTNDIYEKIDDFSLRGYTVTIKNPEDDTEEKIYALNKDDLTKAFDKLVSIFVPTEQYQKYLNDTQEEIADTGEYINNVYILENITIKEGYISTSLPILSTYEEISSYLLYRTIKPEKKYTVKKGDTIASIAYDNGLSVDEFLIANPDLKDDNVLLSGNGDQNVNVEIINPLVSIIYETDLVEEQIDSYNTNIKYDPNLALGITYTQQQGENGVIKVKFQVQYKNGDIYQIKKISSSEIIPAIDKIVVRGGNKSSSTGVGNSGVWYWPTIKPYMISSGFGYRWGTFHDAIDISGCGHGSPIYAANDGVVIYAGTTSDGAITVQIDHNNGYITKYVHLKGFTVRVGQKVSAGDIIGFMGNTGNVSPRPSASNPYAGTHLHFTVYYSSDGINRRSIDPRTLNYQ